MKIVLVIDQFDDANNGTTISGRRFAAALKEHGNEVRVIAIGKNTDYKYAVRQMKFPPVVEHLITSQGMRLAIPNRHVFEKAAAWADVVFAALQRVRVTPALLSAGISEDLKRRTVQVLFTVTAVHWAPAPAPQESSRARKWPDTSVMSA